MVDDDNYNAKFYCLCCGNQEQDLQGGGIPEPYPHSYGCSAWVYTTPGDASVIDYVSWFSCDLFKGWVLVADDIEMTPELYEILRTVVERIRDREDLDDRSSFFKFGEVNEASYPIQIEYTWEYIEYMIEVDCGTDI